MGLLQQGITVLNFDDSLVPQDRLRSYTHEWIDLNDLSSTKRYCERDSLKRIQQRLTGRTGKGITLLGSGDFHYVSHLLLAEVPCPFTLILFDHHSDMMGTEEAFFSCGSWVSHSLQLENLKKVVVIGAHPRTFLRVPDSLLQNVLYVPYTDPPDVLPSGLQTIPSISTQGIESVIQKVIDLIPTEVIYISIDKDVLARREVITNWDQGMMSMEELLAALHRLVQYKKVIGVDICGEYASAPLDLLTPKQFKWICKNQEANLKILQTLLSGASKKSSAPVPAGLSRLYGLFRPVLH